MIKRIILALMLGAVATPAVAADKYIRQLKDKDVFSVSPDRAYLLFRANVVAKAGKPDIIFVRDLTDAEVQTWKAAQAEAAVKQEAKLAQRLKDENAARKQRGLSPIAALPEAERKAVSPSIPYIKDGVPNVVRVDGGRTIVKTDAERTYLIEVPAGTYLIAGQSFDGMVGGTCMCMGSVRFTAAAGQVTDLGHVLSAPENGNSDVPEFKGMMVDADINVPPWIMTVRPVTKPGAPIAFVGSAQVVPASYVAAAKFSNYFGMLVNRMPPIDGVLRYDGDVVLGTNGPVASALLIQGE